MVTGISLIASMSPTYSSFRLHPGKESEQEESSVTGEPAPLNGSWGGANRRKQGGEQMAYSVLNMIWSGGKIAAK